MNDVLISILIFMVFILLPVALFWFLVPSRMDNVTILYKFTNALDSIGYKDRDLDNHPFIVAVNNKLSEMNRKYSIFSDDADTYIWRVNNYTQAIEQKKEQLKYELDREINGYRDEAMDKFMQDCSLPMANKYLEEYSDRVWKLIESIPNMRFIKEEIL